MRCVGKLEVSLVRFDHLKLYPSGVNPMPTGFWINYGVTEHIAPSHKQWIIAFAVQLIVSHLCSKAAHELNTPDSPEDCC